MSTRANPSFASLPRDRVARMASPNVAPVSKELLADLETPISAYLRLRDLPSSFLLDSVEGPAQVARFSVLGGDPRLVLECDGAEVRALRPDGTEVERGRPVPMLARHLDRYRAARDPELPPFTGGFLGYFGYDAVRLWERLPDRPPDDLGLPVFRFALMDTVVVFDHRSHTLRVTANAFLDEEASVEAAHAHARERIDQVLARLRSPRPPEPPAIPTALTPRSNWTPEHYCRAVERAQEHIRAGDIYQVILSQRFATPVPGLDPLAIYRALRVVNPSPCMFFLDIGGGATLVGSSPERLVRLDDGRIEMRPLAGTPP